jgi:hypothetical protein
MKLRESGDSPREAIGAREITQHRPLHRRQSTDQALAIGDPPQLGYQFGHNAFAQLAACGHGKIVAITNYIDKRLERR